MKVYKGFLSAAMLEAIDGLKAGTTSLEVPGTAIQNGITPEQYTTAVVAALASCAMSDDNTKWKDSVPKTIAATIASYALSYEVWLKHKEEVSEDERVANLCLRLYNNLTFSFVNSPNSNLADIDGKAALYTGCQLTGHTSLDETEFKDARLASEGRKKFGSNLVIKNDSITKIKSGDILGRAEKDASYTSGKFKNRMLRCEKPRQLWADTLRGLVPDSAMEVLRTNSLKGHVIIIQSAEPLATEIVVPPLDYREWDSFIRWDEISGENSVLYYEFDFLGTRELETAELVKIDQNSLSLDEFNSLGQIVDPSKSMGLISDNFIYELGLDMLIKQKQLQDALDDRDSSATATMRKLASYWWILLLILALILLIWLLSRNKGDDNSTQVVINTSGTEPHPASSTDREPNQTASAPSVNEERKRAAQHPQTTRNINL